MKIQQLYESVTAKILAEMEAGSVPWVRPWKRSRGGNLMPHNRATQRGYSGINVPLLWCAADEKDYPTHEWLTYQQAEAIGGQVRAGEKATQIVFARQLSKIENEEEKRFSMLRTYNVFNAAQIDGLPTLTTVIEPEPERHARAEALLEATGAVVRHGGDKAYYAPALDLIALPPLVNFKTMESYYATRFHETVHWSGSKSRLDRDLSGGFGSKSYGFEELVAEFGAAFLCAHLGITGELRHADYIANWVKLLKDDHKALFKAASLASRAADYLREFSEQDD